MCIEVWNTHALSVGLQASSVLGIVYCSLRIIADNIYYGTANYTAIRT
jgi:hypothetical protein